MAEVLAARAVGRFGFDLDFITVSGLAALVTGKHSSTHGRASSGDVPGLHFLICGSGATLGGWLWETVHGRGLAQNRPVRKLSKCQL